MEADKLHWTAEDIRTLKRAIGFAMERDPRSKGRALETLGRALWYLTDLEPLDGEAEKP